MNDLVSRASSYAVQAHIRINHRRKYSLEPYDVHLKDVADIVSSVTNDPEVIAAAWLHDIVEDTPTTFLDLEREFGPTLADLVCELTDVSRPSDGNRATRKTLDRTHLAKASPRSKTVKLADLIDNCRDICANDPDFAKVYLTEMAALLDVLHEGHPLLYSRALKLMHTQAEKLGLPLDVVTQFQDTLPTDNRKYLLDYDQGTRNFFKAFTARDIARPLPSVDATNWPSTDPSPPFHIVGIRRHGFIEGFAMLDDPTTLRPFRSDQLLDDTASFAEVISALAKHDACFIRMLGTVNGVITREEIQHPFVRMWLFGIITMLEMRIVSLIETLWPDNTWTSLLSEGRIEKAQAMLHERIRRNQHSSLLSCLQFSDKMQIVIENETILREYGFPSKKMAKRVCKELESLRNNLAHAQDIVTHDFAQIARIARRLESIGTSF